MLSCRTYYFSLMTHNVDVSRRAIKQSGVNLGNFSLSCKVEARTRKTAANPKTGRPEIRNWKQKLLQRLGHIKDLELGVIALVLGNNLLHKCHHFQFVAVVNQIAEQVEITDNIRVEVF